MRDGFLSKKETNVSINDGLVQPPNRKRDAHLIAKADGNLQTCKLFESTTNPMTTEYLTPWCSKINECDLVVNQERQPYLFYYQYTNGEPVVYIYSNTIVANQK